MTGRQLVGTLSADAEPVPHVFVVYTLSVHYMSTVYLRCTYSVSTVSLLCVHSMSPVCLLCHRASHNALMQKRAANFDPGNSLLMLQCISTMSQGFPQYNNAEERGLLKNALMQKWG